MVQFASGMLLSADGEQLTISFGEQDCEARRAALPLQAALADALTGLDVTGLAR